MLILIIFYFFYIIKVVYYIKGEVVDIFLQIFNKELVTNFVKIFLTNIVTILICFKLLNQIKIFKRKKIYIITNIIVISLIYVLLEQALDRILSKLGLIVLITFLIKYITEVDIKKSIIIVVISLGISYILLFLSLIISFIILKIFEIKYPIMLYTAPNLIYIIFTWYFLNINKFKNGLIFLHKKVEKEYFNYVVLNLSIIVLFMFSIFTKYKYNNIVILLIALIIFSIIMFITIQKSLQLYYKQRLLEQDLEETKKELEEKKKEIELLEKENLSFSKKSHSLAHKQKALEYKINQILLNSEMGADNEIQDRVREISKELYGEKSAVELVKTDISPIDDMLKYMQSECIKNKIDFELKIQGNIHYMVNNLIEVKDLEILLADHIKNAIIAINYSNNINKSILVKLGKIDGIYSVYIYDSGIEFESQTLLNLGKKPSTTHKDSGGTGMGFMNTFDTLNKYKASLIINEYNEPSKDNYTKSIVIKFDKQKQFNICSYKQKNK